MIRSDLNNTASYDPARGCAALVVGPPDSYDSPMESYQRAETGLVVGGGDRRSPSELATVRSFRSKEPRLETKRTGLGVGGGGDRKDTRK